MGCHMPCFGHLACISNGSMTTLSMHKPPITGGFVIGLLQSARGFVVATRKRLFLGAGKHCYNRAWFL